MWQFYSEAFTSTQFQSRPYSLVGIYLKMCYAGEHSWKCMLEDSYRTLSHFARIIIILHSLVCSKWELSWTHRSPYGDVSARATVAPQISPFWAPPSHTRVRILGIQPPADAHCTSISHITSLLERVPSIILRLINEIWFNRGVGGWLWNYRDNSNNNQEGAANLSSK